MSDRLDFFFRQRVTESELNLAFELLEKADRNLAADLAIHGIVSGAEPAPHEPVADLTIDLSAPARAYDRLGQRLFFGTGQRVDCSVDLSGIPTSVTEAGQERWLGIFLAFDRLLSDPRTDGHSREVFFRQDESFRLTVRQGPPAPEGAAEKVALEPGELLVCDVRRRHGQRQIVADDIETTRRQALVFAYGDAVRVATTGWEALRPEAETLQAALNDADQKLADHFSGEQHRHEAAAIDFAPHGFLSSSGVGPAIQELVDRLSAEEEGQPGAAVIGAAPLAGTPHDLPAGSVGGQLQGILAWLNEHVGADDAHAASAISVTGEDGLIAGTNAQAALMELARTLAGGHFRGNEEHAGEHRTIHQPALGAGRVLLWEALGSGSVATRLRVYADSDSVWFTLNAAWSGAQWVRDSGAFTSGGFRFSRNDFELFHEGGSAPAFSEWSRSWRLPMLSEESSALIISGPITERGRLAVYSTNTANEERTITLGGSVTFRNRFAAPPSSVTFTPSHMSPYFLGLPTVVDLDQDGFVFSGRATVPAGATTWWIGSYEAAA